jgi:hypothetical protein
LFPENPKFLPSNIDLIAERNGCFFISEWKHPDENMSGGQRLLLRRLANLPKTVVLLVEGDTDNGMHVEDVLWIPPSGAMVSLGNTKEDFIQAYKEWYAGANKVEVVK